MSSSDAGENNAASVVERVLDTSFSADVLHRFPVVQERVRRAVATGANSPFSVGIIDRTALWRSIRLLEGRVEDLDPFLAVADLATVLGAVIFDDCVIVLGDEPTLGAEAANDLLGVEGVIRPLGLSPYEPEGSIDRISTAIFQELPLQSAQRELIGASIEGAEWLDILRQKWATLLPGTRHFPSYHEGQVDQVIAMYQGMPYDNYQVFIIDDTETRAWSWSSDPLHDIIIDNDFRALYYERVVQCFTAMLQDSDCPPSVHYASGCLRSPMVLARAELAAKQATTAVGRLQRGWKALESANALAAASAERPALPFWAHAVFAAARRREDIPGVVGRYRSQAHDFRKRRGELERAIQRPDEEGTDQLDQLIRALLGDTATLSRKMTSTMGTGAGIVAEVVSDLLFAPVPGIGAASAWLTERLARSIPGYLFRPHLHILISLGKDARGMREPLKRAEDLFELSLSRRTKPSAFLEALGQVAWIT